MKEKVVKKAVCQALFFTFEWKQNCDNGNPNVLDFYEV